MISYGGDKFEPGAHGGRAHEERGYPGGQGRHEPGSRTKVSFAASIGAEGAIIRLRGYCRLD